MFALPRTQTLRLVHFKTGESPLLATVLRTYHQLRIPLELHGMGSLLLQYVQLMLPEQLLMRQQLELVSMLEGASRRRVHRRPERGCPVH